MLMNKGPSILKEYEDHWETDMGAWFAGERVVFRGKDLFTELNDLPWMGLLLYGITGRIFDEKQIKLFEGIWSLGGSYPDPRIWNNRIGALAGTTRSTASLALAAATAVSEATLYGRKPDIKAIDFLFRAEKRIASGESLHNIVRSELRQNRVIPGYGRPVVRRDERIKPLLKHAQELGLCDGKYTALAREIEAVLLQGRWRLQMNTAMLVAALAADQGLNAYEYNKYTVLAFSAGITACYVSTQVKPEGVFFPLEVDRIHSIDGQDKIR